MLFSLATAMAQTPPNVLLIVLDDVGVDKLVRYQGDVPGYAPDPIGTPVTPMIDSLIDDGVRFKQAWSNPMCSPTRAALLTGRNGYRTGVGYVANEGVATGHLDLAEITLPEVLDDTYATALFGKWHLGDEGADDDADDDPLDWETVRTHDAVPNPNRHGFEVFDGSIYGGVYGYWNWRRIEAYNYGILNNDEHSVLSLNFTFVTADTAAHASAFMTTAQEPFFAMVAMYAAHPANGYDPLHAQQGCSTLTSATTDQEVYRAMVECADFYIDDMVADLDAAGRLDDTIIILTGDNGPQPPIIDPAFPRYANGKSSPYESGIRVPLIVTEGKHLDATPYGTTYAGAPYAAGDLVQTGEASNQLVGTIDLFDTILDLAGEPETGDDSVSFVPHLVTPGLPGRTALYSERFEDRFDGDGIFNGEAIRRNARHKLIIWQQDDGTAAPCQRGELYDLIDDRAEAVNLYDDPAFASVRDAFRADLDARITAFESAPRRPTHWMWTLADGPRLTGSCP